MIEVGQRVATARRVPQPPPGPVRDEQVLAEDRTGELGQIGAQAPVLGER